ncbi:MULTISPECIES: helix-turn-helix transcriptional regulator [unclassified Pseudomonas]|uniref:helix-turn-helix domain-containing protein n=1 Tax=unclassified Pseudomonas TaxID=196821 RepID=UPI0015B48B94|nr:MULTISPECIES: helix-turn-helix transcriptional regulator [unclassified Pseudomonas]
MQADPNIVNFDVKVDKQTGLVRFNARSSDGRTTTQTFLGPGLEEITRYDPRQASTHDRDTNIMTLLAKGLTQAEVGTRLGVSQSLVSKVYRTTQFDAD